MNENQKKTTDEYRDNWDNIFKKKEEEKCPNYEECEEKKCEDLK